MIVLPAVVLIAAIGVLASQLTSSARTKAHAGSHQASGPVRTVARHTTFPFGNGWVSRRDIHPGWHRRRQPHPTTTPPAPTTTTAAAATTTTAAGGGTPTTTTAPATDPNGGGTGATTTTAAPTTTTAAPTTTTAPATDPNGGGTGATTTTAAPTTTTAAPTTTTAAPTTTTAPATDPNGGGTTTTTTTVAQPPPPADPNANCALVVPPNALSAQGLATPYQFQPQDPAAGPCHESDPRQSAFVEASIFDPATNQVSIYRPLVVDAGTQPAVPTVGAVVPAGAIVGIWFGSNGDTLALQGNQADLQAANCVNGIQGSIFGQFAYCNAPAFFDGATKAVAAGTLAIPALGTAKDGQVCPTTRDFALVDQDQSDNVVTTYLVLPDGRTAQDSAANRQVLKNSQVQANGSDNRLLDALVDPAIGCTAITANDQTASGQSNSLALNELQAAALQKDPIAMVPPNDPMALVDGATSLDKTNAYRAGVNMAALTDAGDLATQYCQQLMQTGLPRIQKDQQFTQGAAAPNGAASNLFVFLAARFSGSFDELGCGPLLNNLANPVTVTNDADGMPTGVSFNGTQPAQAPPAPDNAPDPGQAPTAPAPAPAQPAQNGTPVPSAPASPAVPVPPAPAPAPDTQPPAVPPQGGVTGTVVPTTTTG
jgi:hypothetical protein